MKEERCGNCKFFEKKTKDRGKCHRYPPKVGFWTDLQPWVNNNDWCGEFQKA